MAVRSVPSPSGNLVQTNCYVSWIGLLISTPFLALRLAHQHRSTGLEWGDRLTSRQVFSAAIQALMICAITLETIYYHHDNISPENLNIYSVRSHEFVYLEIGEVLADAVAFPSAKGQTHGVVPPNSLFVRYGAYLPRIIKKFIGGKQWRCMFFVVKQIDPAEEPKIMEPDKHVALKWIEWEVMWDEIKAQIEGKAEQNISGEENKRRYFQSMVNMVNKYPKRSDAACLERRL
ncbi:hypothetical protein CSUB01_11685 [Colletotrichum sublineola]|uniref:Uncharacterized protein n=1 Tax=Colletotrichum sublineola TaxID=1173701 RepID=A0A066XSH6_COLSU|nr:hypothetical protein CSUB01_11685 [Colletotrichum sublineola]